MNNSVFGKTCEDVRNYNTIKIVQTEKQIDRLSVMEEFKRWHIYNPDLATVLMERRQVTLCKPRYIGSAILAISKTLMYDFHYNYMVVNFKDCKVIFTDTDSFCYMIPYEKDVYAKIRGEEWFDFSNFQIDHENYSDKNEMVPGKFKDECPNNTILEVAGLRAKMYAILTMNGDEKRLQME